MKEKKNVGKKIEQVDDIPSKGKIMKAWVLLIVLLGCTGGLVYLKNFKQPVVDDETENVNQVSPVIIGALTDIVDKFNASTILNDYREEGLILGATLNDTTISITYTNGDSNGSVDYVYNIAGNLSAVFANTDKEVNDKIFKAIIIACRERVNQTEDITSDIDNFVNNDVELYGLKKDTVNNNITYYVDIRYPGFEPQIDVQTSTTDTNDDNAQNE